MKFVVGIGNPGRSYAKTRHNIGFRAVETLAKNLDAGAEFKKQKDFGSRTCCLKDVTLVLPETFVNNTGDALRRLQKDHSAKPSDFLVVCDDVNLVFGKLRLRPSGSPGGHHGLESAIAALGSEDFPRLRIGIGNDSMPANDLAPYVLSKFDPREEEALVAILEKAARVCESWIRQDFDGALSCLSRLQSVKQE